MGFWESPRCWSSRAGVPGSPEVVIAGDWAPGTWDEWVLGVRCMPIRLRSRVDIHIALLNLQPQQPQQPSVAILAQVCGYCSRNVLRACCQVRGIWYKRLRSLVFGLMALQRCFLAALSAVALGDDYAATLDAFSGAATRRREAWFLCG